MTQNYDADLSLFIGGSWKVGEGRDLFPVVDPAHGETIAEVPLATPADLDEALAVADKAFVTWRNTAPEARAVVLKKAAVLLRERVDAIARILTLEQGKPLAEARAEVISSASFFDWCAEETTRIYGRVLVRPEGLRATVTHEPVGPVAAFSPWNFPLSNVGRKLGAPIAAGCSVILKAAEETPASALEILDCLYEAGLPGDVAQAVFGEPAHVSSHLIASPVIRKISFTGSTRVGKSLMKLAAEDLKRTTMELGGHGPVLVFDDVDVDRVLDVVVPHKYRNAGQVCVAPTRFVVQEGIYDRFLTGFVERARAIPVGDGMEDGVKMGPLANARRPDAMERLIADAVAAGGKLECGGARIGNRGFFFAPTVLSDVPLSAEIMNEEPFGPVALINRYATEDDMVAEANRLPYGLAAYCWTSNAKRQMTLPGRIEAGMLAMNTNTVGSPDSPFGGVKWSGHGSEDGPEGLAACLVTKAIHEG